MAKGIFEVDPGAIVGKRLSVPRGDPAMRSVCLGVYKKGQCVGILIILN